MLTVDKLEKFTGKNKAYIRKALYRQLSATRLRAQICAELFERDWTEYV
jgi:cyanate lyase